MKVEYILLIACIFFFLFGVKASELDIQTACTKYKAKDCDLVKAIAWIENNYKNRHVIDVGSMSYGPMQIKCAAARDAGLKYSCEQLRNKWVALRFGIRYLEMKIKENRTLAEAIVSYNSYQPIICKQYNPGKCYPGEFINQKYLIKVLRHYAYLKGEKLWMYLKSPSQMKMATPPYRMPYTNRTTILQETLRSYRKTTTSSTF
jgi:hypothetical protein